MRGEATGATTSFSGDVAATAKRALRAGETLDGEGGYTVYGKLRRASDSLREGLVPIGLAHGMTLRRDIAEGDGIGWDDVEYEATRQAIQGATRDGRHVPPARRLMDAGPIGDAAATRDPRRTAYRRITLRLMPLVVLSYCCAYVDRVNVGFAKLRMLSDLHFSDLTYGFGAGIFFIGYFLFEIPSNLLLQRYGARVVLATIMVVWSVISAATSLVHTPAQFYVARLLLGLAEAGLSPGIMLYLTYWFPPARRGFALGAYYVGVPLAGIVGGPLSGMILKAFAGSTGFRDWQWLVRAGGDPVAAGRPGAAGLRDQPAGAGPLAVRRRTPGGGRRISPPARRRTRSMPGCGPSCSTAACGGWPASISASWSGCTA